MIDGSIPTKIGRVNIRQFLKDTDREYSDGDTEDVLLELFKSPNAEAKRLRMLASSPEWGILYHIAYARENLLNWYDFSKGSTVLEVGAGCGAITSALLNMDLKVDALDISLRRSLINAYRHRNQAGLNVIIGNVENYQSEDKYDYVTSIGVLEYSGQFINDESPYLAFLKLLREQLKPNGKLILAIENKFGIKYWAGAKEDHTGLLFDSIEGYPDNKGICTFGKHELATLLERAGYKDIIFYYPFPDYKLPVDIYSDSYLPGSGGLLSSDLFPTPTPGQTRAYLFSESLAIHELAENNLFDNFANSFLVFAMKGQD